MNQKYFKIFIAGLVLLIFLTACAQQTAEQKLLSHWEKIVAILTNNKDNPSTAAGQLKEYLQANLTQMRELSAELGKDKEAAKNINFIEREKKVRQAIINLEKNAKQLLESPEVKDALYLLGGMSF